MISSCSTSNGLANNIFGTTAIASLLFSRAAKMPKNHTHKYSRKMLGKRGSMLMKCKIIYKLKSFSFSTLAAALGLYFLPVILPKALLRVLIFGLKKFDQLVTMWQ